MAEEELTIPPEPLSSRIERLNVDDPKSIIEFVEGTVQTPFEGMFDTKSLVDPLEASRKQIIDDIYAQKKAGMSNDEIKANLLFTLKGPEDTKNKKIGPESLIQTSLPGFDTKPFDPHRQYVEEVERSRVEAYDKGRLSRSELWKQTTKDKLQAEGEVETDPLTGLYNRRGFKNQMDNKLRELRRNLESGRNLKLGSFVIVDVDHFKLVNDKLSHAKGDELLMTVARLLEEAIRPGDTLARFGGDEFAVHLETVEGDEAVKVTERLRLAVENAGKQILPKGFEPHPTASIGVADQFAIYPYYQIRDPQSLSDLVKNLQLEAYRIELQDNLLHLADIAQYEGAKKSGKNKIGIWRRDPKTDRLVIKTATVQASKVVYSSPEKVAITKHK